MMANLIQLLPEIMILQKIAMFFTGEACSKATSDLIKSNLDVS